MTLIYKHGRQEFDVYHCVVFCIPTESETDKIMLPNYITRSKIYIGGARKADTYICTKSKR